MSLGCLPLCYHHPERSALSPSRAPSRDLAKSTESRDLPRLEGQGGDAGSHGPGGDVDSHGPGGQRPTGKTATGALRAGRPPARTLISGGGAVTRDREPRRGMSAPSPVGRAPRGMTGVVRSRPLPRPSEAPAEESPPHGPGGDADSHGPGGQRPTGKSASGALRAGRPPARTLVSGGGAVTRGRESRRGMRFLEVLPYVQDRARDDGCGGESPASPSFRGASRGISPPWPRGPTGNERAPPVGRGGVRTRKPQPVASG
jgi:hypothetical protein